MTPLQKRARLLIWLRRIVQVFSLSLFVYLLLNAANEEAGTGSSFFFDIDPLVQISTILAAHKVTGMWLLALGTTLLTLLLGRVFCGWICPLGVVHNAVSWLRQRKAAFRLRAGAWSGWQRAKYCLLIGLLLLTLLGANWIGVFDPATMLTRSLSVGVLPGLYYFVDASSAAIYNSDPHIGPLHLTGISEPIYHLFRDRIFLGRQPVHPGGALILLVFIVAVALNLYRPRFWCRYVCPTGALLGLFARRPALRLTSINGDCNNCGLCTRVCPAAAEPERQDEHLAGECFGCWNCVEVCKKGSLDFRFAAPFSRGVSAVDIGKRRTIGSLLGGLGGLALFRISPRAQGLDHNPELIRPPGSLAEPDFLSRCVQCGLCMQACPTAVLQPTFDEAGLEGLWTPMLRPRPGYCEYECKRCSEVCPTGAIEDLLLEAKKQVKIGLASFDTTRCLPYAYGRECIVCEEHCPVPDKAIYFEEVEVPLRDGSTRLLKQPKVDPDLCIGCSICEAKCPFTDLAGIRVTSAGETRHPRNQPILPEASTDEWGY
ncbi:MAG: 4Fe-4S dicluster domain-containing protein [bacterium]|nr:4Fe-4S dicluster domain-containing protein [bacterium]